MAETLRWGPAESDAEPIQEQSGQPATSAAVILTGVAETATGVATPAVVGAVQVFTNQTVEAETVEGRDIAVPMAEAQVPPRASIVVSRNRGTVVVTVNGELNLARAGDLGAMLADLIDGQGNLSVVVDLHDATASDADCLWVFTDAAERARRHGGTIKVSEPPGPIYSALQLRGLDNFVGSIVDDS